MNYMLRCCLRHGLGLGCTLKGLLAREVTTIRFGDMIALGVEVLALAILKCITLVQQADLDLQEASNQEQQLEQCAHRFSR